MNVIGPPTNERNEEIDGFQIELNTEKEAVFSLQISTVITESQTDGILEPETRSILTIPIPSTSTSTSTCLPLNEFQTQNSTTSASAVKGTEEVIDDDVEFLCYVSKSRAALESLLSVVKTEKVVSDTESEKEEPVMEPRTGRSKPRKEPGTRYALGILKNLE